MKKLCFIFALFIASDSNAGVFKCTDASGHTFYQSLPCSEQGKSVQINPKTGSTVDLDALQQNKALISEQQKQEQLRLQAESQAKQQELVNLKKRAQLESELTQTLIKQNSLRFSAYAIPAYNLEALPVLVKPFARRLPEIEKFRRLAAEKALATGQCNRVESDELHAKSKQDLLVFLVNCSSAASFYFNETELK